MVIGGLNLVLGLLSLLPGLPLDGGRVVRAVAWARTRDRDRAGRITARIGRLLGWSTVGVGVALAFMDRVTEGLLILALGWLLATGARSLDRRLVLEGLLRGIRVDEATRTRRAAQSRPTSRSTRSPTGSRARPGVLSVPVVEDERGARRDRRRPAPAAGPAAVRATTRAADVMAVPPQAPFLAPATTCGTPSTR